MSRSAEFDPTLVRRAVRLPEATAAGHLAAPDAVTPDAGTVAMARRQWVDFVVDLATRDVQMLVAVMAVGRGESPDLEDTMETTAARFESKHDMALRMFENPSLVADLSRGLRTLLIDPVRD